MNNTGNRFKVQFHNNNILLAKVAFLRVSTLEAFVGIFLISYNE